MSSFVRIIFDSYEVIYVMVFKGERVQSKVGQKSGPKSFLLSILCCLLFDNSEGFAFLYEIILQIYHKPQLFKHVLYFLRWLVSFSTEDVLYCLIKWIPKHEWLV